MVRAWIEEMRGKGAKARILADDLKNIMQTVRMLGIPDENVFTLQDATYSEVK